MNLILQEVTSANRAIVNLMDVLQPATPCVAPCDANQLVRQALSQVEVPEGVEVQPLLAQQLPEISVDAKQMIRVLENVLLYQFSGLAPGSKVRVLSRHSQTRVLVDLVDSGSGITREQVAALFQANQPDKSCCLHLGLNAARVLIQSNGGQLEIESRLGVGTRYSLVMPVA
ncbi:MAG: ATP-binding protein [Anaerolineae bacterium]